VYLWCLTIIVLRMAIVVTTMAGRGYNEIFFFYFSLFLINIQEMNPAKFFF
jgi:hypothetical protein